MITKDIDKCVELLSDGELVSFPTETVYGLGARADDPVAVSKIFEAKARPKDHPLIVHGPNADKVFQCAIDIPQYARDLSEFWPGPMSLILKRSNSDLVCDEAVGGQDSVALRVPGHDITLELLEKCDFLVAGPSANKFSYVSPTSTLHVQDDFGDDLLVLEGGNSHFGVESTIVSCLGDVPKILRSGSITALQIAELLNISEDDLFEGDISDIKVSGNLKVHYSPGIPVYVFSHLEELEMYLAENVEDHKAYLGFNDINDASFSYKQVVHSVEEFAHKMYSFFRSAEYHNCSQIVVIAPNDSGLGVAINDRLEKASSEWRIDEV